MRVHIRALEKLSRHERALHPECLDQDDWLKLRVQYLDMIENHCRQFESLVELIETMNRRLGVGDDYP